MKEKFIFKMNGFINDLQKRLNVDGVSLNESQIMHLAYSQEIAAAMLQRQQAHAVLSARKVIVDGAVALVKAAIEQLQEQEIVELDDEKKAQMVNNLMVAQDELRSVNAQIEVILKEAAKKLEESKSNNII